MGPTGPVRMALLARARGPGDAGRRGEPPRDLFVAGESRIPERRGARQQFGPPWKTGVDAEFRARTALWRRHDSGFQANESVPAPACRVSCGVVPPCRHAGSVGSREARVLGSDRGRHVVAQPLVREHDPLHRAAHDAIGGTLLSGGTRRIHQGAWPRGTANLAGGG